jgi:ribosomal protein S18 acetylase RimI-like enzyme
MAANVRRLGDVEAFRQAADPLLMADEARHNLMLGVCWTIEHFPETYPAAYFWVAEDGGEAIGAALLTPPFNVLMARPVGDGALDALAAAIVEDGVSVPGAVGAVPEVNEFAAAWRARTGKGANARMAMGIHRLTGLIPPRPVAGQPRMSDDGDLDLLRDWMVEFANEAHVRSHPEQVERSLRSRWSGPGGLVLWEVDGRPVSMAGFGQFTPNGARVGPVYTPREHRGRGFASAVTAHVSSLVLDGGRSFCFLFTDLSNPTSNHVYEALGYERIAEASEYEFEGPPAVEA